MTQVQTDVRPAFYAPHAPALPFLGNALPMRTNPARYFLDLYREHGPVFRIRLLGRDIVVMAGLEANQFLARGDDYFSSEDLFQGLGHEQGGTDRMLTAIDGIPHRHQRKVQRRAYSREAIITELDKMTDITRAALNNWPVNEPRPLFRSMQHIVTDQLGTLIVGIPAAGMFDDLLTFFRYGLSVLVLKSVPRVALYDPRYQMAKRRVLKFAEDVLQSHRDGTAVYKSPLLEDMLNMPDEKGLPYDDATIIASIIGGYFAGLDTVAATLAFMVGAILRTPGLEERIVAEVDAHFVNGRLPAESMRKMPVLHNTAIETLRLYAIAPFTPRQVGKPFDFGGYHFPVGTNVFVAQTLTHLMPEYFPNPDVFDIDRYDRPDFIKVPQAYAPFTLGAHTCLGAGLAEVQLMATVATLFHYAKLELYPREEPLTIHSTPIPNPGTKIAIRVTGRR